MDIEFESFKYYGAGNFLSSFFVKEILERLEYIESNISNICINPECINDLYLYLWCFSFKQFAKDVGKYQIEISKKQRLLLIDQQIILKKSGFVKYLNANYFQIFDENNHKEDKWSPFFFGIIELCFNEYSGGIKQEVFKYLEERYPLHLLSDFDICSSYFANHKEEFHSLFNGLEQTKIFDDQIYLDFLINYADKSDDLLAKKAAFMCERVMKYINRMNLTSDSDNIIQIQSLVLDYKRLAVVQKLTCANRFNRFAEKIQKTLDDYVFKHGIKKEIGPFNLKPFKDFLVNTKDEPYKYIILTHDYKTIRNSSDYILKVDQQDPLSEAFTDLSRKRSDKYPYFKQNFMQINIAIRANCINMVLNDEKLSSEFVNYLSLISNEIQNEYFKNIISIDKEVDGIVKSFLEFIRLAKNKQFETNFGKVSVYGLSMTICSTIEKILRNVALLKIQDMQYFDSSTITLTALFKDKTFLSDISDGLKYHIEFYLLKEIGFHGKNIDKPGLNIRNDLMHGIDNAFEKTNYETCMTLFYFLISILGDLLIALKQ